MRPYTPRRAGQRWLKGAPEYILDCLQHKEGDGFDILFTGKLLGTIANKPQDRTNVYIMGLDVSKDGAYCSFELKSHEAAQYRYRNSNRRIGWLTLPEAVRKAVEAWAKD